MQKIASGCRDPRRSGLGTIRVVFRRLLTSVLTFAALAGNCLDASEVRGGGPSPALRSTLPFVESKMFFAEFWIQKLIEPDRPLLDAAQIDAFNARVRGQLSSLFFDLGGIGPVIAGDRLRAMIEPPEYPGVPIYVEGRLIDRSYLEALFGRMNLAGIQEVNPVRYGYVVRRANMRRYPSLDACVTSPEDRQFDQLQSTVVNPAIPIAILHSSPDGKWFYCCKSDYSGWMSAQDVALSPDRSTWLRYLEQDRFLVVTRSLLRLGYNPYSPELSELPFEMGARIPLAGEPVPSVVDHQNIAGNYVVKLPTRGSEGMVVWKHALVAVSQDVRDGFLPYTRANLLRQAFKVLGERYGWGGLGLGKDCSAYLQDLFLCCGLVLPRDSGQQVRIQGPADVSFDPLDLDYARRTAQVRALQPGAELFWGGHVLLYVGEHAGRFYVLHSVDVYGDAEKPVKAKLPYLPFEPIALNEVVLAELTQQQARNGKLFERLVAGKRYE